MTAAHSATIVQTVGNLDWNSAVWGTPSATPTAGNDYVTATGVTSNNVRLSASGTGTTFNGGSLKVVAGTTALLKNINSTSKINGTFTLDGGTINHGPNGSGSDNLAATLDVTGFSVTSASIITIGNAGGNLSITAPLSGSGDLSFQATNSQTVDIVSFAGISGYTGAISLGSAGALSLSFGTTNYTFSNSLGILGTSVLRVNSGQTLTFTQGQLTDPTNGTVAAGSYTGSGLTALGANYFDGGGTIVVLVPEPSGALLGLLGSVLLLRRKRK